MSVIRIPPQSEEAEQAVLGALMIDHDALMTVSEIITPDHFYNDNNKEIYLAMTELADAREPIDILTLTTILKKKKLYTKIGGADYLTSLASVVPTAANIDHYARIMRERYIRRTLIKIGSEITESAFSEDKEAPEILEAAEQTIFRLAQEQVKQGFIHIKDALAESFDRLEELYKSGQGVHGIESGFVDLDRLLSGFHDSNLIVLAARPGTGKTAFALNVAQYVSLNHHHPVGMFSLEMSREELVDRMLVAQSDIDAWKLKTKMLNSDDYDRISQAMGILAEVPIYIDDTPGITIGEIKTKARRLQLETGLRMVIVDYLQLVNPGKRFENRVQEVSHISAQLKNLARELKIPVIALSQLSRAVEQRGEKRPQLSDLRESGGIEQDADVVMFLYAKDDEPGPQRMISVSVAKHRNGPIGERDLLFRGDRLKFYSISEKRVEEYTS